MKGLMIHAGGYEATIDQVAAVKTPLATATHVPIPHIDLIEEVERSLERLGVQVTQRAYALAGDEGQRFFGLMNLESPWPDRCTTLGLRNAHDKTFAINGVIGNNVFVCDNLAFSGEVKFNRKHTVFAERDLPQIVDVALGKLMSFQKTMDNRVSLYKFSELDEKTADHAFMNALRAQVVSGSTLCKVFKEYTHPRHPEFKENGFTVWRLYNAFTENMKDCLWNLPKRTIALHAILDSLCPRVIDITPIHDEYALAA